MFHPLVEAGKPQKASPVIVVPPWNFCAKPAHLFLHVLRFERLWRFGVTIIVTVVQFDYRPPIGVFVRRFWHILIAFEGVNSRPSYLGDFARHLISRPLSADRDTPSKDHELFGAADDIHKRATALSGAEEETVDIFVTIPKLEGW